MKKLLVGAVAGLTALVAAPAVAGATGTPVVTLLHGIPGVTVDVYVDGTEIVPDFAPSATQDLSSFAGTTLTNVEVKLQDGTVAISVPSLAVPSSGNWTVVAHLTADGTPTITPFQNDVSAVASGSGRVTVRHTAAAPAVDLVLPDGTRPITNLSNPNESVLELPSATYAGLKLAPTGADPIIDVPTITVADNTNLIVYAVGSLSSEPPTFTFYTQTIVLELPSTGAGQVAVQLAIGSVIALAGLGLVLLARRRPVTA